MKRSILAILLIGILVLSGCKATKEETVALAAGYVPETETVVTDTILPNEQKEPEGQPDASEKDASVMGGYGSEKEDRPVDEQDPKVYDETPGIVYDIEEYETGCLEYAWTDEYRGPHVVEAPVYDESTARLTYDGSQVVKYEYNYEMTRYNPASSSEALSEEEYIELARAHCEKYYGKYMPLYTQVRYRVTQISGLNRCYQVCFGRYGGKGAFIYVEGAVCNMWDNGKVHSSELQTNEQLQAIDLAKLEHLDEETVRSFGETELWKRLGPEFEREFENEDILWEYDIWAIQPNFVRIFATSHNEYGQFDLYFYYEYESGDDIDVEQGTLW
ncbi:MAG: hypothetical protein IJN82_02205 [Clostridia bacterium]|nr:hypothetical protein [Clostridia bacterium]